MIECENCNRFFHSDDIISSQELGMDLCKECYQEILRKAKFNYLEDDEEDET